MSDFTITRRRLILSSLLLPLVRPFGLGHAEGLLTSRSNRVVPSGGTWKWDTVLWDADRRRLGSIGREFFRLKDKSLVLRLDSHNEQGYNSDTYSADIITFALRSIDDGFTWQKYDGPLLE